MIDLLRWYGQKTLIALLVMPCVMLVGRSFRDQPRAQPLLSIVIGQTEDTESEDQKTPNIPGMLQINVLPLPKSNFGASDSNVNAFHQKDANLAWSFVNWLSGIRSDDEAKRKQANGFLRGRIDASLGVNRDGLLICDGRLTDDMLERFAEMPKIDAIHFVSRNLTDAAIQSLKKFPLVRRIRITSHQFTDAGLQPLGNLNELEELTLFNCEQISGSGLVCLQQLPAFKTLLLSGSGLTDEGMKSLAKLPHLQSLSLTCDGLTDEAIANISECPDLKQLAIGNHQMTDSGVAQLSSLKKLESLELSGKGLTGKAFQHIGELPQLRKLTVHGMHTSIDDERLRVLRLLNHLTELDVWANKVTESGIAELTEHQDLRILYLHALPVTPSVIRHLVKLKKLTHLRLSKSAMTDAEEQQLKAGLPDCDIEIY